MDSSEKGFGVLCYIGPLFILSLILGNSQFIKFHANQGLLLFIIEAVLGAICGIISFVPFFGWIISGVIGGIVGLVILLAAIYGIVGAAQGQTNSIPLLGSITIIK